MLYARTQTSSKAKPDPSFDVVKTYSVGAMSSEGIKLAATKIEYRKAAALQRHFIQATMHRKIGDLPVSPRQVQIDGFPAIEFEAKTAIAILYQRRVNISSG